jgi:hypothetical protein
LLSRFHLQKFSVFAMGIASIVIEKALVVFLARDARKPKGAADDGDAPFRFRDRGWGT